MKKENNFEKTIVVIVLLTIGFFGGILFSTYNLQVVNTKKWGNGELVTIKILERSSDYYYEK